MSTECVMRIFGKAGKWDSIK